MHQKFGFTIPLILLACLAAPQFIFQVRNLYSGPESIVATLTNDDTYYYLQTAWNTVRLGFVTFDGLHSTNGVQSLWFGIVVLLSVLTHTKTGLLSVALTLCFLLNASCYFVIWKLGSLVKRPAVSLLMASAWSMLSFSSTAYSSGMENSLHALLFWCAIWQVTVFLVTVREGRKPHLWIVTSVLIANCWVRLDSILVSALLFFYCIVMLANNVQHIRLFLRQHVRLLSSSCLLAIAGLGAQLICFFMIGGSFLPVSALIKMSDARVALDARVVKTLVDDLMLSIPTILPRSVCPTPVLLVLGFAGALILARARSRQPRNDSTELSVFINVSCVLFSGILLYHLFTAVLGLPHTSYFIWYRSPAFISWIIIFSLAAHISLEFLAPKGGIRWLLPCSAAMLVTASFIWFFMRVHLTAQENNMHATRYRAGMWIANNLPPDAILASWNAGELGYFSNRSVINLDGLVNSIEYYRRVLKGRLQMKDYLYENGVTYIVDYIDNDLTSPLPVLRTFTCTHAPDLRLKIWQVPQHDPKRGMGSGA